jgi:hypothetical protein
MELKLGGKLEIGDPILVSYTNGMFFGLFAGYGRGTIQYYIPNNVIYRASRNNGKPKFYKGYIHGSNIEYRVAKVTPDVLYKEKDIIEYEKAIEILKQENIVK